MAQDAADEFYTVTQAAKALGVSVSTVWRWIKARRLPAFRLGPKAIRIRKRDVDAVVRPVIDTPRPMTHVVYTHPREALEPLTEDERRRARVASAGMDAIRAQIHARRKGRLMPDSTSLIRAEREKRSRQI